jgi:hypothetical protein
VDFNGDGAKDLITGENYGCIRFYRNTGTDSNPQFSGYTLLRVGGSAYYCNNDFSMPEVVDWDNDGVLDVICGDGGDDTGGRVYLLHNTGSNAAPVFPSAQEIPNVNVGAYGRASPTVVDWDGDGDKDLLVGETYGKIYYYENTGTDSSPSFTSGQPLKAGGSTLSVGYYARPTAADWNSDGTPDLLVGSDGGTVWYFQATAPLPTVTIAAVDGKAWEPGPDTGLLRISRSGPTDTAITVSFTLGGNAARGLDYVLKVGGSLLPGYTVPIPAGQTSVDIVLEPVNDPTVEPTQQAVFSLAVGAGYALGTSTSATVTITDNTPLVTVTASDPKAAETLPGKTPNPGAFTLTRTGGTLSEPLTVQYDLAGSTATPDKDYSALPATIAFGPNVKSIALPVTVIDDDEAEPTESVIFNLTPGSGYKLAATGHSATVTIADNEPVVSVTASGPLAAETLPGQKPKPGAFKITRSGGDLSKDLSVNFSLDAGTATAGQDYADIGTSITIPALNTSVTIPVTALDDDIAEPTETAVLALTPGANYSLAAKAAQCSATVKIADNEPIVTVTASDPTAAETLPGQKPDAGVFTITRTGGDLGKDLLVQYTLGGSATNGDDYDALALEATIPAGLKSIKVAVTPKDDDIAEGTETVVLALSTASGKYHLATSAAQRSATVKIADNEPTVCIRATDAAAAEVAPGKPPNLGVLTVTRTGGDLSKPLTVKYDLAGSTADAGVDYETLAGEVTILAGAKSATIIIAPKADEVVESPKTVVLTLVADALDPKYLVLPTQRTAKVTITDTVA